MLSYNDTTEKPSPERSRDEASLYIYKYIYISILLNKSSEIQYQRYLYDL